MWLWGLVGGIILSLALWNLPATIPWSLILCAALSQNKAIDADGICGTTFPGKLIDRGTALLIALSVMTLISAYLALSESARRHAGQVQAQSSSSLMALFHALWSSIHLISYYTYPEFFRGHYLCTWTAWAAFGYSFLVMQISDVRWKICIDSLVLPALCGLLVSNFLLVTYAGHHSLLDDALHLSPLLYILACLAWHITQAHTRGASGFGFSRSITLGSLLLCTVFVQCYGWIYDFRKIYGNYVTHHLTPSLWPSIFVAVSVSLTALFSCMSSIAQVPAQVPSFRARLLRCALVVVYLVGLLVLFSSSLTVMYSLAGKAACPASPTRLVETVGGEEMELTEAGQELLRALESPIYVHSAIGVFRGGKSTAMTLMARGAMTPLLQVRCPVSFPAGHTQNGQTRGIWAWALPLSSASKSLQGSALLKAMPARGSLLLLDTEGLDDPHRDVFIAEQFALLSLLTGRSVSFHIDNSVKTTDIERLGAIAERGSIFLSKAIVDETHPQHECASLLFEGAGVVNYGSLSIVISNGRLFKHVKNITSGSFDMSQYLEDTVLADSSFQQAREAIRAHFSVRTLKVNGEASEHDLALMREMDCTPGLPNSIFLQRATTIMLSILQHQVLPVTNRQHIHLEGTAFLERVRCTIRMLRGASKTDEAEGGQSFKDVKLALCNEQLRGLQAKAAVVAVDIEEQLPVDPNSLHTRLDGVFSMLANEYFPLENQVPPSCLASLQQFRALWQKQLGELNARQLQVEWSPEAWGPCEGSCPGNRKRRIHCLRNDGVYQELAVCDNDLHAGPKPTEIQDCDLATFSWTETECEQELRCLRCGTEVVSDVHCAKVQKPKELRCS